VSKLAATTLYLGLLLAGGILTTSLAFGATSSHPSCPGNSCHGATTTATTTTSTGATTTTSSTLPSTSTTTSSPTSTGGTTTTTSTGGTTTTAPSFVFGTLNTAATNASAEAAAGVNSAEVEVGWDLYEPQDGVFDSNYAAAVKQKVQAFKAVGDKVILGLDLHYPPSWVFSYPNSKLIDQYGGTADEVNLVFNQTLRNKAAALINRINQDVGLNNFYAIRITSGGDAEAMYPPEDADGAHANAYWAYDANAQGGANLPPTIPVNPFPGWKPGQKTYAGQPFTTSNVQQWYSWYLKALVDEANSQIQTYKSLGYGGYFYVLTPGLGSRPDEYQTAIANYLNGTGDANATMGRGAAWDKWYAALPDRTNVIAYVSSLADWSGSPANNVCQPADSSVGITDPQIDSWSAARWISYLAGRYNMPKTGENPGGGTDYGFTMMQVAAQQMQSCGMQGMYWAHDADLYSPGTVTLQDYATVIAGS